MFVCVAPSLEVEPRIVRAMTMKTAASFAFHADGEAEACASSEAMYPEKRVVTCCS